MTEYKKLVALTDLLSNDVTTLCNTFATTARSADDGAEALGIATQSGMNADAEQLHSISCRIRHSLADGCPRIRKLVQKARETDPNRQIYNEAMCAKIEGLFKSFCDALSRLAPAFTCQDTASPSAFSVDDEETESTNPFTAVLNADFDAETIVEQSPPLHAEEDIYNQYILKRAMEEAWQSRVAQGLSDVVTFEAQNRSLVAAEEKLARAARAEEKRCDKMRIIRLLEEREEAKWNAELQRRDTEQRLLLQRAKIFDDIATIPSELQTTLPDATVRRSLAGRVQRLIKALLRAPEDVNIRRLRNNNEHLICDYGHPCLLATDPSGEGFCMCTSIVSAAEALWSRMGYSIRYTSTPNRSVESVRLEKRAEEMTLPCGLSLAAHMYKPLGFEDYSERFFELMEPNAMEKPDEWMVWYNMIQEMEQALAQAVSQQ